MKVPWGSATGTPRCSGKRRSTTRRVSARSGLPCSEKAAIRIGRSLHCDDELRPQSWNLGVVAGCGLQKLLSGSQGGAEPRSAPQPRPSNGADFYCRDRLHLARTVFGHAEADLLFPSPLHLDRILIKIVVQADEEAMRQARTLACGQLHGPRLPVVPGGNLMAPNSRYGLHWKITPGPPPRSRGPSPGSPRLATLSQFWERVRAGVFSHGQ